MKASTKRLAARQRETAAEVRELADIEARVLAGKEPIVSGEDVMRETLRDLAKATMRRRRA